MSQFKDVGDKQIKNLIYKICSTFWINTMPLKLMDVLKNVG